MSRHTYIAFHLPKWGGGKWHLPYWGTAISEDHAACRLSTMLKTGINDHRIYTTLAEIRAEEQNPNICKRCSRIAVERTEEVN